MRVPASMRTTAARLSALYLLLFSLCAVILVFYMTGVAARFILDETRVAVGEEVLALGDSYARGGLRGLVRGIDRRARQPGANLYLVADPAGRILAGNVQALDPQVLEDEGWTEEPFRYERFGETVGEAGRRPYFAVAQVIVLPNGMRVLVGRDLGEPERFRNVVRQALMMALGVMGVGALLIWYFVGRRALRRIDRVSVASQRIMGGDLTGRLPVTEAGDEFDRLSENLNSMLERIAVLNEGLRQVSDSIAHDLKTPLTRLRNRAERALVGGDAGVEREALEGIIAEADQLIAVFNALLMISRVEAGYSGQDMQPVDLAAVVADVVELYEPVAEEEGVELATTIPGAAAIRGNRELIGQALTNLVDNAFKYASADKGGAKIAITLAGAGDGWDVIVADNGRGIPEDDRERVFERFVRLDESRSKPGSGLGLALVRAVMRLHGGSAVLEDAAPGLRVRLHFPSGRGGVVRA